MQNLKHFNMKKEIIEALKDKYVSEMSNAKVGMKIYLSHPVGVGEHPNIIEEIDKMFDTYCQAKDKLETLRAIEPEL